MVHVFGDCEIDEELFEVRVRGVQVPVAPKVFDTLMLLMRNQHRVVTKAELLSTVWEGSAVTNDAVNQAVRRARRILSTATGRDLQIQTVRGRGYRFVVGEGGLDGHDEDGGGPSSRVKRSAVV